MEPCPFEHAFPEIHTGSVGSGWPKVGGTDTKATREERRAARKKAKRCKGPALVYSDQVSADLPPVSVSDLESFVSGLGGDTYASFTPEPLAVQPVAPVQPVTDPDRPAVQRMKPVEAMAAAMAAVPSYFGAGEDDDPTQPAEGYRSGLGGAAAGFVQPVDDTTGYKLGSEVTQGLQLGALPKLQSGTSISEPNLNDFWKPAAAASSYTAYLGKLPASGASIPGWASHAQQYASPAGEFESAAAEEEGGAAAYQPIETAPRNKIKSSPRTFQLGALEPKLPPPPPPSAPLSNSAAERALKEERDQLRMRMNDLITRLDLLERERLGGSQKEILLSVGAGLFLLMSFDIIARGGARR
jgi:hypothetical protein